MKGQYVKAKTFEDFCTNQDKLIDILNHNITELTVDVKWIKKGLFWMLGIFGAIFASALLSLIKG